MIILLQGNLLLKFSIIYFYFFKKFLTKKSLHFIFQQQLLPALDLIDNSSITKVECDSGRSFFQVLGSSNSIYVCFTSSNYCSCPAFVYSGLIIFLPPSLFLLYFFFILSAFKRTQ